MQYFADRYTPKHFNEIVFASDEVASLLRPYAEGKRDGHVILYGPFGTGKSTLAKIIAEDAKGRRTGILIEGIDPVVHATTLGTSFTKIEGLWWQQGKNERVRPYCVIDEVDQLTNTRQQQLRAFIDQNSYGCVVMTTNNLHLVDGGLLDRSKVLKIEQPSSAQWLPRARHILDSEGKTTDDKKILELLKGTESTRQVLDALSDACASQASVVSV